MELTWLAIAASLMMGLGAAAVFVFAVKKDYFRDLEDSQIPGLLVRFGRVGGFTRAFTKGEPRWQWLPEAIKNPGRRAACPWRKP
jgi:hypothetical protein